MQVTIYALCDPLTFEVRYIGKANDLEARMRSHRWEAVSSNLRTRKVNWLRSLNGVDPVVHILEVVEKALWEERERYWIKYMRSEGANLTNYADGGQTSPVEGRGHSEETKRKISEIKKKSGDRPPPRTGTIPWNKGMVMSQEARAGMSIRSMGRPAWNKGIKMSDEHCKSNSRGHLGVPWSKTRREMYERKKATKI